MIDHRTITLTNVDNDCRCHVALIVNNGPIDAWINEPLYGIIHMTLVRRNMGSVVSIMEKNYL